MENNNKLVFGKLNYLLMLSGILVIILGFIVMSMDGEDYGFGSTGLTVGPLIVLLGFGIEFAAILIKSKK